jgi:hypothetical protein
MNPPLNLPQIGGPDPLDAEIEARAPVTAPGRLAHLVRTRAALGLPPLVAPALVFVSLGVSLGPHGLDLVSPQVVAHLDAVLAAALAALGIFVGLGVDWTTPHERRLLAAANVESTLTAALVALAAWHLIDAWRLPLDLSPAAAAAVLGLAAAASSAGHADPGDDPLTHTATRLADLDDVAPIVLGGILLAAFHRGGALDTALLVALTAGAALAIAAAGWLLFERARGAAERAVFVLGAVLLLGGAAMYVGNSPLFTGLVAGLFWRRAPGRADQVIRDDLRRLQHPLVVLLLVIAGASVAFDRLSTWLLVPFVAFRLAGKLAAGWAVSRATPALAPADLGAWLIPPGLVGLAFALSVAGVVGSPAGTVFVSAVALGTLASEVVAMLVVPAGGRA